MTAPAEKAALLERLAANDGATPAERETALRLAARLRERAGAPSSARPSVASSARAEWRGGVECWVGEPPVHGRVCFQGPGGCAECAAIERWRAWLRKGVCA